MVAPNSIPNWNLHLELFLVKSYNNGPNKRFTQNRVTKCRLWLKSKTWFEVKSNLQLFSSKQVSSWSVGLVCRQSTMRESRDLNNEGNPPGWPWQIPRYENSWVKKEKSFCGFPGGISIHYLASGWPWSNMPDYVIHINISQTLGICFIFHAGNGNTRVQIFPNSKQGWQGQMTAGWFGEIQADFWMLLGRYVKRGELTI